MPNSKRTVTTVTVAVMLLSAGTLLFLFADSLPVIAGEPNDLKLKELFKERLATLRQVVDLTEAGYKTGKLSFDEMNQAMRALLNAELDACESEKDRRAVLEKMLALAKTHEEAALSRHQAGFAQQREVLAAKVSRLEVEIDLERTKAKATAKPK